MTVDKRLLQCFETLRARDPETEYFLGRVNTRVPVLDGRVLGPQTVVIYSHGDEGFVIARTPLTIEQMQWEFGGQRIPEAVDQWAYIPGEYVDPMSMPTAEDV